MHQRLRCAGHGHVDLICPAGCRFGKVSRRAIGGEWDVAAVLRRRAYRQELKALPYARFTEPSSTGGKWPVADNLVCELMSAPAASASLSADLHSPH